MLAWGGDLEKWLEKYCVVVTWVIVFCCSLPCNGFVFWIVNKSRTNNLV